MSAASRPHTDDSPESAADAEGWALLEGLRRRLDEQANQNRKTQTQVTQLADSIAALVAVQRKRARWMNVNSFAAYVIFTLLCALMITGMPISIALGLTVLTFLFTMTQVPLESVALKLFTISGN